QAISAQVENGQVPTSLAETRVLFDGIAAPLLSASSTQTTAMVPLTVGDKTNVTVEVEFRGARSQVLVLSVLVARPGIFTANSTGVGQGAVLNENGSYNSSANPAEKDSVITLYATGMGSLDSD